MTNGEIRLYTAQFEEVTINTREALRYMGYQTKAVPEDIEGLLSACLNELSENVSYKACVTKCDISFPGEDRLDLGFGAFHSAALCKNLNGCKQAYLFAATCGAAADRLIMRYSKTQPSKSVVTDALASAAIEGFCNRLCDELKKDGELKPRFSPGYGDLPLSLQPQILEYLDAYRKVGITLSQSLMMTPTKSVTAIAGIKECAK